MTPYIGIHPLPLAGGGLCAAGAFLAWAVRGRSAAVFGRSVWRGNPHRRALALTFDDGPSEGTPAILDILAQYRVPATFFQVGANVDRLPEVARAVAAAGHAIGNHSYAHPLFCFRSPGFIEADLRRAQQTILARTDVEPEWFRAPYGVRWFGMGRAQRRLSLTGVMWSAIGRDWSAEFRQCFSPPGRRSLEWRYPVSTRWARTADQSRYPRHRGSRAAPGPRAAGTRLRVGDRKQIAMSDELIQRVIKVIANTKRIPIETVTIDSDFVATGHRLHGCGGNPLRARERVRHQHPR